MLSTFRHTCKAAFRFLLRRPHGAAEISRQGRALGLRTRGDPDQHLPVGAAAAGSHSGGGRRRLSGTTLQTVQLKGPTTLEHRFKRSPNAPWNFVLMTLKTFTQHVFTVQCLKKCIVFVFYITQSNKISQSKHIWTCHHFQPTRAEKH